MKRATSGQRREVFILLGEETQKRLKRRYYQNYTLTNEQQFTKQKMRGRVFQAEETVEERYKSTGCILGDLWTEQVGGQMRKGLKIQAGVRITVIYLCRWSFLLDYKLLEVKIQVSSFHFFICSFNKRLLSTPYKTKTKADRQHH